jgi:hypothetical protein
MGLLQQVWVKNHCPDDELDKLAYLVYLAIRKEHKQGIQSYRSIAIQL